MVKYVVTENRVIAIEHYAGKTYKGVAKCAPDDAFNEEVGKDLAFKRLNVKISDAKVKRIINHIREYDETISYLYNKRRKLMDYLDYCGDKSIDYSNELYKTEKHLR